jgi:hypothetical protein
VEDWDWVWEDGEEGFLKEVSRGLFSEGYGGRDKPSTIDRPERRIGTRDT